MSPRKRSPRVKEVPLAEPGFLREEIQQSSCRAAKRFPFRPQRLEELRNGRAQGRKRHQGSPSTAEALPAAFRGPRLRSGTGRGRAALPRLPLVAASAPPLPDPPGAAGPPRPLPPRRRPPGAHLRAAPPPGSGRAAGHESRLPRRPQRCQWRQRREAEGDLGDGDLRGGLPRREMRWLPAAPPAACSPRPTALAAKPGSPRRRGEAPRARTAPEAKPAVAAPRRPPARRGRRKTRRTTTLARPASRWRRGWGCWPPPSPCWDGSSPGRGAAVGPAGPCCRRSASPCTRAVPPPPPRWARCSACCGAAAACRHRASPPPLTCRCRR